MNCRTWSHAFVVAGFEPASRRRRILKWNSENRPPIIYSMNNKHPEELFPRRRRTKLPDYDYSSEGAYFITICIFEKQCLLGSVIDSSMKLNQNGEFVASCWRDIPLHYPCVKNDVFIVMPNHFHGIVTIDGSGGRAGSKPAPTRQPPLSEIIRAFKTYSSRRINEPRNCQGHTSMATWLL